MAETAAEFLNERRDFLYVYAARSVSGKGWDVVVRFDGTYSTEALAKDAAKGIRMMFNRLSDLRRDGRDWWDGPPSKGPQPPRKDVAPIVKRKRRRDFPA